MIQSLDKNATLVFKLLTCCLSYTVGRVIPPARTYAVGGLQPGRKYELRVTAHNAAGASPALYAIQTPTLSSSGKFFFF